MTTPLYPTPRIRSFILSEATGQLSRENIVLTGDGAAFESGALLTKSGDSGTAAFAMDAGATGNPTSSAIVVTYPAVPGNYKVVFEDATHFTVETPTGETVKGGVLGAAFSAGGLAFTLTAGGTAAIPGSTATIAVAAGTGKYTRYTAAGAAGPADAILYNGQPAFTGDRKVVGFTMACEVNRGELTGLDASGEADLLKKQIKVRGAIGLPTVSTPAL